MGDDVKGALSVEKEPGEDGTPKFICRCTYADENEALTMWLSLTHTLARTLGHSSAQLGFLAMSCGFDKTIKNAAYMDLGSLFGNKKEGSDCE